MVPLGYAIANPTYNNYESQGGFGLFPSLLYLLFLIFYPLLRIFVLLFFCIIPRSI